MDQEEHCLDFKSLRAKYQDEEVLLKQPRTKPALPLKPKVLSPPHSPTNSLPSFSPTSHTPSNSHALPPGARPSLLSSLQGKGGFAPRVIFEEKEKKLKGKDLLDQKQKIEADLVMKNKKVSLLSPRGSNRGSVELVDASPPPINATEKKKGFRGIRKPVKSGKKGKEGKGEFPPLPMLDIASPDMAGPEPLIALTTFRTPSHPANIPIPTALIPPAPAAHIARLPPAPIPAPVLDARLTPELLPSTLMPAPAAETITVVTPPDPPTLEVETPAETIPAPTLAVLVPPSPTPSPVPAPPSPVPTPPVTPNPSAIPTPRPPTIATPSPPAIPTLPPPTIATPRRPVIATPPQPADPTPSPPPPPPTPPAPEPESVVVDAAVVVEASASTSPSHTPPPPAVDPPVTHPSPQPERPVLVQERPLSALSALGRAEEMIPQKKRGSEIIFNALEKAKRKFASPDTSTIEDQPPLPHKSLPELPPIDYDDQARAGPPTPLKPALDNGVDVRQAFPVLEGIAGDVIPDLLVAPPPLLRRHLPEASTLRPLQEKPLRLPSMDLTAHAVEIPAPLEFSVADPALDVPEFEDGGSELLKLEALEMQPADLVELGRSEWGNGEYGDPELVPLDVDNIPETVLLKQEILEEGEGVTEFEDHRVPEFGVEFREFPETVPASPSSQDPQPAAGAQAEDSTYESCDNANEHMPSAKQKVKGQSTKKKKEPKSKTQAPYNPYAETQSPTEGTPKTGWSFKKPALETPEEKALKKKEKQHLEKEKKEQKERARKEQKERARKEQKEREKKENEMKKFKITGQEEAIYQATVTVASKGRKNDLAVKNRDIVSIIRTTNCPKGKWLARDSTNTYGYISVSQVELDIKEMLELGKKASHAISHKDSSTLVEQGGEVASMGSRTSNHYPLQEDTGSFTDESEEWMCDDDEALSSPIEEDPTESGHIQTMSMMGSREPSIHHQHTLSDTTIDGMQARHEALQKLATFFHKPVVEEPIRRPEEPEPEELISPVDIEEPVYPCKEEADLAFPGMVILPPPDLYSDDIINDA